MQTSAIEFEKGKRYRVTVTLKRPGESAGITEAPDPGASESDPVPFWLPPAPDAVPRPATPAMPHSVDPIDAFIEDCCEINGEAFVCASDFNAVYECWSKQAGLRRPVDLERFRGRLYAMGFLRSRSRRICGCQARTWEGIGLQPDVARMLDESKADLREAKATAVLTEGGSYSVENAARALGWDVQRLALAIRGGQLYMAKYQDCIAAAELRRFVLANLDLVEFARSDRRGLAAILTGEGSAL